MPELLLGVAVVLAVVALLVLVGGWAYRVGWGDACSMLFEPDVRRTALADFDVAALLRGEVVYLPVVRGITYSVYLDAEVRDLRLVIAQAEARWSAAEIARTTISPPVWNGTPAIREHLRAGCGGPHSITAGGKFTCHARQTT